MTADVEGADSEPRRTVDRVMRFALEANFRHAKFAARLITCMKNADKLCADIVEVSVVC